MLSLKSYAGSQVKDYCDYWRAAYTSRLGKVRLSDDQVHYLCDGCCRTNNRDHRACIAKMIKQAIQHRTNPKIQNVPARRIIRIILLNGYVDMLEYFLNNWEDFDLDDSRYLDYALQSGNTEILRIVMTHANVSIYRPSTGLLANITNPDMLTFIVDQPNYDIPDLLSGMTACGHLHVIKYLDATHRISANSRVEIAVNAIKYTKVDLLKYLNSRGFDFRGTATVTFRVFNGYTSQITQKTMTFIEYARLIYPDWSHILYYMETHTNAATPAT